MREDSPSRYPTSMLRRLCAAALCLCCVTALPAWAQSPRVLWEVSSYGPRLFGTGIGCGGSNTSGGCSSDNRAMAVDAQGNVFVTGFTNADAADNTGIGWKTTKFNGATGAVLWESIFNSSGNGPDQAYSMTLDPSGNAIVVGYQWNGTDGDIKVIKYAAATGTSIWEASVAGTPANVAIPNSGNDFGIAAATDAAGNVFIGGSTWNGSNDDMRTVKLAAATGAVVWDKTFNGPGDGPDYVFALAVDAQGNVIVTGESRTNVNPAGDPDWKTIKYAAADGAILWQKVFAGAAAGLDIPNAVAIDKSGNVLVSGYTFNGANSDMKIIKYAALDGTVLWESGFANPAGGDDFAYALATDGAGIFKTIDGGTNWTAINGSGATALGCLE
ncbi:MAG: PQQ-binding-like beta-propeller repeat protein, partial [Usitatibacteraceae bacterium]